MKKWNLSWENDSRENFTHEQQMQIDLDNPFDFDFTAKLELNRQVLRRKHGCSVGFNPCMPESITDGLEAKWVMEHYGLDASYVWVFYR